MCNRLFLSFPAACILCMLLSWTLYAAAPALPWEDYDQEYGSAEGAQSSPSAPDHSGLKEKVPEVALDFQHFDGLLLEHSSLKKRSLLAHSIHPAPPSHSHLPSWRGLVPYGLPPPSLFPA